MVPFTLEGSSTRQGRERRVARLIIGGGNGSIQRVDDLYPLSDEHFQWRIEGHWAQVDEKPTAHEHSPSFKESMNHALMRYSSE